MFTKFRSSHVSDTEYNNKLLWAMLFMFIMVSTQPLSLVHAPITSLSSFHLLGLDV